MIRTEGLTRRFGDMTAVDNLTLEVDEGEVFGFLGPNGAGKTTTTRMLTALIKPSAGRAWVADHPLGLEDQEIRHKIGILTETPGLYVRLNAMDNLRFFGRLHGLDKLDARIERYLKLMDLWDRRHEPVGGFSKGMRQKIAISRALLHEPRVLFLDEPTSGLDPISARVVRDFIADLKAEGRTIFLCTHNLDEAERLCDRVALFKRQLVSIDTPTGLRKALYGHTIRLTLGEVRPAHIEALKATGLAQEVTHDTTTIDVRVNDPDEDNPALIEALVKAGAALRFVQEVQQSLEQIYFDLLADDGAGSEALSEPGEDVEEGRAATQEAS